MASVAKRLRAHVFTQLFNVSMLNPKHHVLVAEYLEIFGALKSQLPGPWPFSRYWKYKPPSRKGHKTTFNVPVAAEPGEMAMQTVQGARQGSRYGIGFTVCCKSNHHQPSSTICVYSQNSSSIKIYPSSRLLLLQFNDSPHHC